MPEGDTAETNRKEQDEYEDDTRHGLTSFGY
jgi:hypothetical protein